MRWNVPEVGDIRWRRIFLLIPRQIGRQRVWLEWIWVQEVYRNGYITFNESEWEEVDWRFDRPESPVMSSQGYSESREFVEVADCDLKIGICVEEKGG